MDRILGRYAPHFYALLRIVAGLMFMMHGTQKLFGWPGEKDPMELASIAGVAGIIEFVAGFLITIGLFTSWAAFISSGTMAVAYFMAHASQGWSPVVNQGELAVLYCFIFLYIAAQGSGIWSVDGARRGSSRTSFSR
ncbi:DoxX family protein [Rufibacter tibetensis]|uniref:DoxX family protein n=1 Tax=Rufibacter tibetensis TaxID=512763 RepID=A0A0P0CZH2_9BACT|nr:DoxX family protein [Rufibacter tibetensis]ALI99931.1 DoxX family protein [Rufibacter tibetensis]